MKALIVYCHPNPASFNHAILNLVTEDLKGRGAEYKVKDLYAMGWDPRLSAADFQQIFSGKTPGDIGQEQEAVKWADVLYFIFPVWWVSMPAMLKGWIDRVFSFGFAYHMTDQGPQGLLTDKKAIVLSTSGATREIAANGMDQTLKDSIENGILGFCGITDVVHKNFYGVPYVSDEDRKNMLLETKDMLSGLSV